MTTERKIQVVLTGMALLLCILFTAFALNRDYENSLDGQLAQAGALLKARSDLPVLINTRDTRSLSSVLDELLDPAGGHYAAVYGADGVLILQQVGAGETSGQVPAFSKLRRNLTSRQTERVTLGAEGEPQDGNWFSAIFAGAPFSHLTIPILSATGQPDSAAGTTPIAGFVHVAIGGESLMAGLRPQLSYYAWLSSILLALTALLSYPVAHLLMAPLVRVKVMADDILANREPERLAAPVSGEMAAIANALNTVSLRGSDAANKKKMDEERAAQLSQQNDELKGAVQEAKERKQQLWQLAYYDELTALPNRRLFTEQLDRFLQLAQRKGEQLALLFLDLDDFKHVNDTFGHFVGDQFLREISSRLRDCLRDSDLVGLNAGQNSGVDISRYGGDEFVVVLNQIDRAESAGIVAQRIIDALREPKLIGGVEVSASISVGISLAPGDASDSAGLMKAADTAMYYAKKGGKAGFCYYQNHMEEPRMDQARLKTDLRSAAQSDQLELHYQPQIDVRYGTVVGAEALLRWNHPEQGLIPPLQFIPLAEEMDIISVLGKWTLQEACRQLKVFDAEGIKLPRITVNISALQFNHQFIDTVREVLRDSNIEPSRLQLELTEGAVIADVPGAVNALNELKKIGVCLSFDDFGSVYSPLSYLSRFPLDELKIDRHFVMKSQETEADANLVAGFIAMASCLKMRLVASGVENREQLKFLMAKDAHILQGYLFSAPVTAEKLKPLLSPWHFMEQLSEMAREFDELKPAEAPLAQGDKA